MLSYVHIVPLERNRQVQKPRQEQTPQSWSQATRLQPTDAKQSENKGWMLPKRRSVWQTPSEAEESEVDVPDDENVAESDDDQEHDYTQPA
eukprot:158444-Amphidinium_carterae.1